MIPRSGISAGEGTGYPLQYSWASLVAQLVKNLPAMRETWVRPLGWEDPLEWGKATHSSSCMRLSLTSLSKNLNRKEYIYVYMWGDRKSRDYDNSDKCPMK